MKSVPSVITPEYRIQKVVEYLERRTADSDNCVECESLLEVTKMLARAACGGRIDIKDVETLLVNMSDRLAETDGALL